MKKILALVIAVMVLAASMSIAFADPTTYAISTTSTTHTYEIYHIFTGTPDGNGLFDLKYGVNAVGTTGAAVSQTDLTTLKGYTDAGNYATSKVADQTDLVFIEQFVTLSNPVATIGKSGNSGNSYAAVPGYYLVKDVNNSLAGTDEAYTLYLSQVVGADWAITPKADKPEIEKKVQDKDDSTGDTTSYQDSADYDVGDAVPFQITATTADNVETFKKYHVTIQDKQSAGLDAPTSFTITVLGQTFTLAYNATDPITKTTNAGTKITVAKAVAEENQTFAIKVSFENATANAFIPAEADSTPIVVTYTSVLNSSAVIGSAGNPNTTYLKYSNNPNSADDDEEGKTPEDKVTVFTFKFDVDKIDADGNYLTKAGFTLYKLYATVPADKTEVTADIPGYTKLDGEHWVLVGTEAASDTRTNFTFDRIDAGTYLLVESETPTGYNTITPIKFTVAATHDETSADPQLLTLTVDSGFAAFKDDGTFTRKLKINDVAQTKATVSGEVTGEIINQSGTQLPSTGGIGTTLFYVGGGLLALAAVILLVTKRRMNGND